MPKFDFEKTDTQTKRLGTLGVRSVIHTLYFHHGRKLIDDGCTRYHVYEVTDIDEQKKGIDIVEEWIDAQLQPHQRAHEVKTEKLIISPEGYKKQPEMTKFMDDGKIHRGSGNTFVELIQNKKSGDAGWYPKMKASQETIEQKYSDGRELWIVAYQPKAENKTQALYIQYEIDNEGNVKELRTEDGKLLGFLAHDDGFLLWEIPFKNYTAIIDSYLKTPEGTKAKRSNGQTEGVIVPVDILFSGYDYTEDGRPIYGKPSKEGSCIHLDAQVWLREKKDIDESWTPEDYSPLELKSDI